MIKILFLESHLSTGGGPSFALKRIESLIKYDGEIEMFVVEYSNVSDEYVVQKNKIRSLIKPENFFTLGEDKYELMDIINDNNIDIVHADEILEGFGDVVTNTLLNALYDNSRSWKMVETCHNVWFNPDTFKKFDPDAYAFCTRWHKEKTFINMPSYSEVIEYPIESKKVSPQDKFESRIKLGFDNNKIHIINVGLWTPGKNQKEGIEIARLFENVDQNIQFHFIGNQAGNFADYWQPIMKNIPSNVKIWGERSDISEFMKAADIFMFNSTWECNPIVLKEAISHRLKIISRNLPQYMDTFTPYIKIINDDIYTTLKIIIETIDSVRKYSDIPDEFEEFGYKYLNFYKKVYNSSIRIQDKFIDNKPLFIQHFVNNPYFEIKGEKNSKYKVEFFDEKGIKHYSEIISTNNWIRLSREYYTKWNIKVWEEENLIYEYTLNLDGARVFISMDSRSLGDTLAWIPYLEEFRKKHNCKLIASTFMNYLFKDNYPEIEFVEPGSVMDNIYAMYKIGWYYKKDKFDNYKNPYDFKTSPLQKTASDILGLDYIEIRPKIKTKDSKKLKKVGIGTHATAQSKYWNNPNGWQDVVDYLILLGYEVVVYSSESNGYMGNYNPLGVIKFESGPIGKLIDDMNSCEFFIGLGSGLTWLAWSIGLPVVLISGFSEVYSETQDNTYRVINEKVCHGCFNSYKLDIGDWNWCPAQNGTDRVFECTKLITSKMVIEQIDKIIYKH